MATTNVIQPGFFAKAQQNGVNALNTASKYTKNAAAFAGDTLNKTWSAVSSFFTSIANKLGQYFNAARNATLAGLSSAKNSFSGLSTQNKLITGSVATAVLGLGLYMGYKMWNAKKDAAPEIEAKAQDNATNVDTTEVQ